jgi:hypothetical protein
MVAAQTAKMITIIDPKTPNLDRTRCGTDLVLDAYSIGVLVRTVNPAQGGAESREIAARPTDLPWVAVGLSILRIVRHHRTGSTPRRSRLSARPARSTRLA